MISDVTTTGDRPRRAGRPVGRVDVIDQRGSPVARPDPDPTRPSAIKRRQAKSNIQLLLLLLLSRPAAMVNNMNATVRPSVRITDEMHTPTTTCTRPARDARNTERQQYRGILNSTDGSA